MNTSSGARESGMEVEHKSPSDDPDKIIECVNAELAEAKENMEIVNSLGERYRKDLSRGKHNINRFFLIQIVNFSYKYSYFPISW